MAHPVRPESYVEINNFYTTTVYEKGAEVIRMLHTLIGEDAFQRGMRLYFERHDGQAVTCEDFVAAMEAASGRDLGQFRRWYSQAGTPRLAVDGAYDAGARSYTLSVTQSTPPTPGQSEKKPLHIPLAMALLDEDGRELPLQLAGEAAPAGTSRVLELRKAQESFRFTGIDAEPTPSLLRGFSAPVVLKSCRRRGAAALPDGEGQRPVRALGGGPELCAAADAGAGRPAPRGRGAHPRRRAWPRPSPRRSRTRASSPPSSRRR